MYSSTVNLDNLDKETDQKKKKNRFHGAQSFTHTWALKVQSTLASNSVSQSTLTHTPHTHIN